jgi:ferredoxin-type protein NapH
MKCKVVCPEIQVLHMINKSSEAVVDECTNCGRCVEVCEDDALNFDLRKYIKEKK